MPMLTPAHIEKERYARTRMPGTPQGHHRHGRATWYEGTNGEEQKDHRGKAQHKKKKKKKKTKHTHVTSGVQVCCHATLRNRDVPTAHPHARLCRRRKGAKGNKRYAAACKRIVDKPHTATKNTSMLPCRATSPTAELRGLEHTNSQGGGHGEQTHK